MSENRTFKLIETGDGSSTLYIEELNETFHSLHGALRESTHVFIEAGLKPVLAEQQPVHVLEIGFGTGLNALLTLEVALKSAASIHFTTLEPFPLPADVVKQLNYSRLFPEATAAFWEKIHFSAWDEPIALLPNFTLHKLKTRLEDYPAPADHFDVVYYDAFAPSKQSEMWSLENLEKTVQAMKPGALLVTYCASGQFKRNLKALHLEVETLPGPPGKKEMVRGRKLVN